MKVMPASLTPNPSPASGRGERRESLRDFHGNSIVAHVIRAVQTGYALGRQAKMG
jgi:hypothetical protein